MLRITHVKNKQVTSGMYRRHTVLLGVMIGVLVGVVTGEAMITTAQADEGAKIGAPAPDFTLTDTDGKTHQLSAYTAKGYAVVLEWFNPDCPFIKMHHQANKTMDELYAQVGDQKVVWLAINSNAAGKQGHGLERNQKARQEYEMTMPILLDENGKVGRLYRAKTTPHMFLIGADGTLLYDGAIDDASGREAGETNYVAAALKAYLAGEAVATPKTKPYGCSVKYAN
jgi:peroxiredoxin